MQLFTMNNIKLVCKQIAAKKKNQKKIEDASTKKLLRQKKKLSLINLINLRKRKKLNKKNSCFRQNYEKKLYCYKMQDIKHNIGDKK